MTFVINASRRRGRTAVLAVCVGLLAAGTLAATGAGSAAAAPVRTLPAPRSPHAPHARGGIVVRAAATPAATPAWTTVWSDTFSGTGRLSSAWLYRTGTSVPGGPAQFGTGEVEVDTDSTANVTQSGGVLHVRALRAADGTWTSGRVESVRQDFRPPAGGVLAAQARIRLPALSGAAAQGYWPAFWLLGTPYRANAWSWPAIGELDVMENVQGLNTVWGTMHCDVAPGGRCNEFSGLGGTADGGSPTLQGGFHTYRVEWDESVTPHVVRWYLDGRLFHSVSQQQLSPAAWDAAFGHAYYVILDLAIGGAMPANHGGGPYAATASGGEMLVDDVRVLTRAAAGQPSPSPTSPSPTSPSPTSPSPTSPSPTSPSPSPTSPTASTTGPTASPTVSPTSTPTVPARAVVEAESFAGQSGTVTEAVAGASGTAVTHLSDGDVLRYDGVDFAAGAGQFTARVASGAAPGVSGLVEVRVDRPDAPVLGSFAVASTGGWTAWRQVPANVAMPSGVHTVYLAFASGQPADYLSLDSFSFS